MAVSGRARWRSQLRNTSGNPGLGFRPGDGAPDGAQLGRLPRSAFVSKNEPSHIARSLEEGALSCEGVRNNHLAFDVLYRGRRLHCPCRSRSGRTRHHPVFA